MATLAELISEEILKEDVLKDIKEPLIKAMTAQFKERGYAKIRWGYPTLYGSIDKQRFDEYIVVEDKGRIKVELKRWLSEQGFYTETVYNRNGAIHGLKVTLPGY